MNIALATQTIRESIAIYRALNNVADLLESLAPLEDQATLLQLRISELYSEHDELVQRNANALAAHEEWEKGLARERALEQARFGAYKAAHEQAMADMQAELKVLDSRVEAALGGAQE